MNWRGRFIYSEIGKEGGVKFTGKMKEKKQTRAVKTRVCTVTLRTREQLHKRNAVKTRRHNQRKNCVRRGELGRLAAELGKEDVFIRRVRGKGEDTS